MLVLALAPAAGAVAYGSSLYNRDFPDPSVIRVKGVWYAYGTSTAYERPNHLFPILRSRDLQHWSYAGDALTKIPSWSDGHWWAPGLLVRNGIIYMYYSAQANGHGDHCLALAVSRNPLGPFRDIGPISCGDEQTAGYIDPAPFIDDDGSGYLFFAVDGPAHTIGEMPLQGDLFHPAGPVRQLFGVSQPWQEGLAAETVEGPSLVEHDGLYYLLYSAGSYSTDYRMGYAVAASPAGPYIDSPINPILEGGPLSAPGGGSVFAGIGGRPWLAFNAWSGPLGYGKGGIRTLRIAPLFWDGTSISVNAPGGSSS